MLAIWLYALSFVPLFLIWSWLAYENAGVSPDWWFAVLNEALTAKYLGVKDLLVLVLFAFRVIKGFLRLDFVKLTGHALDAKFGEQREAVSDAAVRSLPLKPKEGLNGPLACKK